MGAFPFQWTQFPRSIRPELEALSLESDPELLASGLRSLASRLEARSPESAASIYGHLAAAPEIPQEHAAVAAQRFAALRGEGSGGYRAEILIRSFVGNSSDYRVILPMIAATSVAGLVRAGALSRLLDGASAFSRGLPARFAAGSLAFAAEVPTFALSGRALHSLSEDVSPPPLGQELAATALTLGCLKGFSALGAKLLPAGQAWSAPALATAGLYTAHGLEEKLGWRPSSDAASRAVDALAASLSLSVGARLGGRLLGRRFNQAQAELTLRSEAALERRHLGMEAAEWAPAGAVYRMSSNKEGGKVTPIFPGLKAPTSEQAVRPPDPRELSALHDSTVLQVDALLTEANKALGALFSAAEIHAQYLERGVVEEARVDALRDRLQMAKKHFVIWDNHAGQMLRKVNALSFGSGESGPLGLSYWQIRLREFRSSFPEFRRTLEGLEKALGKGTALDLVEAIHESSRRLPYYFQYESIPGPDANSPAAILLRASRLQGVLNGLLGPDLMRDPMEGWRNLPLLQKILENLETSVNQGHLRALLTRIHPGNGTSYSIPREGLAEGGTYLDPFRTWIGFHLPALTVFHGGRVDWVRRNLQGIELFMEPSMIEASRETLDWLGFLLERPGDPKDWAARAEPDSVAAVAWKMAEDPYSGVGDWRRNLGEEGPRAILGHALHAFLRGAYEPVAAWKIALASSPSALRQEVLALTGALSGAFQGRGAFDRGVLMSPMQEAFPLRQFGDWTYEKYKKGLLDLPLSRLLRPWESSNEIPSWFRMLNPARQSATRPLQWKAFKEGFMERQLEMELYLFDLVLEASRALVTEPSQVSTRQLRDLHFDLAVDYMQLEDGFRELRRYVDTGTPKLESSLPDSLSEPLLGDLNWRADRLENGVLAFRRFMEELQQEAAKPRFLPKSPGQRRLQEKLFEVTGAFPPVSSGNPETQLITTLMRALRGELDTVRPRPRN